MEFFQHLRHFSTLDGIAITVFLVSWIALGLRIEWVGARRKSVSILMETYRREWFQQVIDRENRVFDSTILGSLRTGTTYFASACMIAIGGALTLIHNSDSLINVAQDLSIETDPQAVWELKLILVLFFVTNGFFKFVWAHRLFGYCSVVAASIPNDPKDPLAKIRASQAAEINITGSRSFTRGMRLIYYALAALAWLAGPVALLLAAFFINSVLIRREFASTSRKILVSGLSV